MAEIERRRGFENESTKGVIKIDMKKGENDGTIIATIV